MTQIVTTPGKTWPITMGAEGMAAAQFARCGFDVQMQAGRDKPWYDLVITRAGSLLKVSVKASEDGQWSLTEGYARRAPEATGNGLACHAAIDRWLDSYGARTICCLVQFERVALHEMPRIYLAFPHEIATLMRATTNRLGLCALLERYSWTSEDSSWHTEALPAAWLFSHERIEELLQLSAPGFTVPVKPGLFTRQVALTA